MQSLPCMFQCSPAKIQLKDMQKLYILAWARLNSHSKRKRSEIYEYSCALFSSLPLSVLYEFQLWWELCFPFFFTHFTHLRSFKVQLLGTSAVPVRAGFKIAVQLAYNNLHHMISLKIWSIGLVSPKKDSAPNQVLHLTMHMDTIIFFFAWKILTQPTRDGKGKVSSMMCVMQKRTIITRGKVMR